MTEKEKMENGFLFNAMYDKENLEIIKRTTRLCHEYNNLSPDDTDKKQEILQKITITLGENVEIVSPFWCDHGNLVIGDNFYANHNLVITDGVTVTIGKNVFIAPNCTITTAEHAIDPEQRIAGFEVAKPVTICDNVWIGANSVVLAGVTIGKNSVIGAGSVVKKDIPENVVAVGVPCKPIREITENDKNRYPIAKD